MNSWDEVDFLLKLLKNQTEVEIQPTTVEPNMESLFIDVYVVYSTSIHEYIMVIEPAGKRTQLETINQLTTLNTYPIHSMIMETIYPIPLKQLSPLNVIDSSCRSIISVLFFSNQFNGTTLKVSLTHSESVLEISFQDLKTVLSVAGAKILQF